MNSTAGSCSATGAVRARDEMLAAVAHDLRTPLSSIVAAAALLTSVDALDPDRNRIRQRGRTIERAARHMSRLLRDLTDVDRIDAGRLAIERTVTSPVDVLHETVEALEPSVARAGGTLVLRLPSAMPSMSFDPHRVRPPSRSRGNPPTTVKRGHRRQLPATPPVARDRRSTHAEAPTGESNRMAQCGLGLSPSTG
jgi:hypothetical protein